jgi:hypothetical protein
MDQEQRLAELESKVRQLSRRRGGWRSRWAAVGAAVAVTLGGGTVLHFALAAPGDVAPTSFVPLPPTRILDTRPAPLNVGGYIGPMSAGEVHTFQVTGVAGVAANATAVVMNVTVDKPTGPSFLTVFPAGSTLPTASNLNFVANSTIPNLVVVKIGAAGQVSVFNQSGKVHVIADVAGYYVPGNDKFISLDIFGTDPVAGATFNPGSNEVAGLQFADGTMPQSSFHFVLPPDYTPGGSIVGSFTWHTAAVSCGVAWRANYVSVSRAGLVHVHGANAFTGMTDPAPIAAGATAKLVQTSTFTLSSPLASVTLQPGDSYTFGIYRAGVDVTDTCAATALIDSMVIRYD